MYIFRLKVAQTFYNSLLGKNMYTIVHLVYARKYKLRSKVKSKMSLMKTVSCDYVLV